MILLICWHSAGEADFWRLDACLVPFGRICGSLIDLQTEIALAQIDHLGVCRDDHITGAWIDHLINANLAMKSIAR